MSINLGARSGQWDRETKVSLKINSGPIGPFSLNFFLRRRNEDRLARSDFYFAIAQSLLCVFFFFLSLAVFISLVRLIPNSVKRVRAEKSEIPAPGFN